MLELVEYMQLEESNPRTELGSGQEDFGRGVLIIHELNAQYAGENK